jgi:hypothetical protein
MLFFYKGWHSLKDLSIPFRLKTSLRKHVQLEFCRVPIGRRQTCPEI